MVKLATAEPHTSKESQQESTTEHGHTNTASSARLIEQAPDLSTATSQGPLLDNAIANALERKLDQRQEHQLYASVWGSTAAALLNTAPSVATSYRNQVEQLQSQIDLVTKENKRRGRRFNPRDPRVFNQLSSILGESAANDLINSIDGALAQQGRALENNPKAIADLITNISKSLTSNGTVAKLGVSAQAIEEQITLRTTQRHPSNISSFNTQDQQPPTMRTPIEQSQPQPVTSIDLAPIKAKFAEIVESPAYRGLSEEARTEEQKNILQHFSKLSAEQQAELKTELINLFRNASVQRDRELATTIQRLVKETSSGSFNEKALKAAYQELFQVAGKGTSQEEWTSIQAKFDSQREDIRRSAMIQEIRFLGRRSVVLGESLDKNKTARAVALIQKRYGDVSLSGREVSSHLKSSYEAEYNKRLSKVNFVSRQYYKASRWLDETGDWIAQSVDRVKRAVQSAATKTKEFAVSVWETGESVAKELSQARSGAEKLLKDAWNASLDLGGKAIEAVQAGAEAVGEFAYEAVTNPIATLKKVGNAFVTAGKAVYEAGVWVADKVEALKTMVKNAVVAAGTWIMETGIDVAKGALDMGYNLTVGCVKLQFAVLTTGINLGKVVLGQTSWDEFKSTTAANFNKAAEHFNKAYDTLSTAASIAWEGAKIAGGFIRDLSDSLGVTDLLIGGYHIAVMTPHLWYDLALCAVGQQTLTGLIDNQIHHLTEGSRALVGAVKCLGEVTGITDLGLAIKHSVHALAAYGRGDQSAMLIHLGQATMHGAFAAMSWGAIAATVASGGIAAGSIGAVAMGRATAKQASKKALQEISEQFFKKGANELADATVKKLSDNARSLVQEEFGKQAVQNLEKKAAAELGTGASKTEIASKANDLALDTLLQREAIGIADDSGKILAQMPSNEITSNSVREVCRATSDKRIGELHSALQTSEVVEGLVFDELTRISKLSRRKGRREIQNALGCSARQAKQAQKEVQKAMKTGKFDGQLKDIYTEAISKKITGRFESTIEAPFKQRFRSGLRGQIDEPWSKTLAKKVDDQAEALGKNVDEFTDELVEAGWKGAREGIESATKKAVREGIERAFSRFRRLKLIPRPKGDETELDPILLSETVEETLDDSKQNFAVKDDVEDTQKLGESTPTRQFTINKADGSTLRITEILDIATNRWIPAGTELLVAATTTADQDTPPRMKDDSKKSLAA